MTWDIQFTELFDRCVELYRSGNTDFERYYNEDDLKFLRGIGCKPRELFDFVEDHVDESAPAPSTALLITAVRRDYLHVVQNGQLVTTKSRETTFRLSETPWEKLPTSPGS